VNGEGKIVLVHGEHFRRAVNCRRGGREALPSMESAVGRMFAQYGQRPRRRFFAFQ
jgi:hypothetical protein